MLNKFISRINLTNWCPLRGVGGGGGNITSVRKTTFSNKNLKIRFLNQQQRRLLLFDPFSVAFFFLFRVVFRIISDVEDKSRFWAGGIILSSCVRLFCGVWTLSNLGYRIVYFLFYTIRTRTTSASKRKLNLLKGKVEF